MGAPRLSAGLELTSLDEPEEARGPLPQTRAQGSDLTLPENLEDVRSDGAFLGRPVSLLDRSRNPGLDPGGPCLLQGLVLSVSVGLPTRLRWGQLPVSGRDVRVSGQVDGSGRTWRWVTGF